MSEHFVQCPLKEQVEVPATSARELQRSSPHVHDGSPPEQREAWLGTTVEPGSSTAEPAT